MVDFLLLPAIRSVNESEQVLIYTVTRLDSNVIETNLAVNFTILTVAGSAVGTNITYTSSHCFTSVILVGVIYLIVAKNVGIGIELCAVNDCE